MRWHYVWLLAFNDLDDEKPLVLWLYEYSFNDQRSNQLMTDSCFDICDRFYHIPDGLMMIN